jgi:hypothetical protein
MRFRKLVGKRQLRGPKPTKVGSGTAFRPFFAVFSETRCSCVKPNRGSFERARDYITPHGRRACSRVRVSMTITMKNIRHLSQPPRQHTCQPSISWPQGTASRRRRNLVSIRTLSVLAMSRPPRYLSQCHQRVGWDTLAEAARTQRGAFMGQQRAFAGRGSWNTAV